MNCREYYFQNECASPLFAMTACSCASAQSETRSMAVFLSMFWSLHLVLLLHHTDTTYPVFTLWSRPHIPFLILQSPWLQFYRHIQPYGQCRVWFYCDATLEFAPFSRLIGCLHFTSCSMARMHLVLFTSFTAFFFRPIVWMLILQYFFHRVMLSNWKRHVAHC